MQPGAVRRVSAGLRARRAFSVGCGRCGAPSSAATGNTATCSIYAAVVPTLDFGPDAGRLTVQTSADGAAARLGHSLTLLVTDWTATLRYEGDDPQAISVVARLDTLTVAEGTGMKPLSEGDYQTILRNAANTLHSQEFPTCRFDAYAFTKTDDGFTVAGTLEIARRPQPCTVTVAVEPSASGLAVRGSTWVRQKDFGLLPYSTMLGALRVANRVQVGVDLDVPLTM